MRDSLRSPKPAAVTHHTRRLKNLPKLSDTKSTEGKTTLLQVGHARGVAQGPASL